MISRALGHRARHQSIKMNWPVAPEGFNIDYSSARSSLRIPLAKIGLLFHLH